MGIPTMSRERSARRLGRTTPAKKNEEYALDNQRTFIEICVEEGKSNAIALP
jgi:hypothetical protein